MWFFMITCYLFTALTFLLLVIAWLQSIFMFPVFSASHVTFIIFVSIIYSFTETLVIFFFVGTGVSVKEYTAEHKLPPDYHRRSIKIKRYVYPPLMLNILIMIVVFILSGAVDTNRLHPLIYQTLFLFSIVHFMYCVKIQHRSFKENTELILAMSGIKQ